MTLFLLVLKCGCLLVCIRDVEGFELGFACAHPALGVRGEVANPGAAGARDGANSTPVAATVGYIPETERHLRTFGNKDVQTAAVARMTVLVTGAAQDCLDIFTI
ncbi:MAG: hypothetical protein P8J33_01295, partial [Pirellulaceae bacterium]|nr:hypothetical protein [Pirellulaceae bacterium]